jgi:hypothetical protein
MFRKPLLMVVVLAGAAWLSSVRVYGDPPGNNKDLT